MTNKPLVRPPAYVDEWTWSWVGRTVKSNGLQIQSPSMLGKFASMLNQGDWDVESIVKSTRDLKVCPECLIHRSYLSDLWQKDGCEVCPEHGWVLQTHCLACGEGLRLAGALEAQCECGAPIPKEGCTQATPRELKLCHALAWSVCDPEVSLLRDFLWQLLLVLARARRGRDISFKGRRAGDHLAQWLELHGLEVTLSIEGVNALLRSLPTPIHQAAASTWLQGLVVADSDGKGVFSDLPISTWLDTLRSIGAPLTRSRSLGSRLRTPVVPGYVSLPGASVHAGVTTKRLRRWILEGRLSTKVIPSTSNRGLMLKLDDVLRCREADAPQIDSYLSPRRLNIGSINRCIRRQLRVCGLLDPASSTRSLQEMPLGEVLRAMTALAVPIKTAIVPTVALSDRQWWRWNNAQAIGQWLRDAQHGQCQLFRDVHVHGFSGLYAPATELRRLHRLSALLNAVARNVDSTQSMDLFCAEADDAFV